MLEEGHRLKSHGTDAVVGFVETHGRPHTAGQIGDLEVIPPKQIPYKGVVLKEMDTDAIIARRPQVALVDELAHTNAPDSVHEKRYQDVEDLLAAGINVISTVNIQHLESLNDYVKQMTGVQVRETLPDWILDQTDQIELIDMAPEALIRRMVHGNIYPAEQARRALENFFTVGNLTALRDIALRVTAKEVEDRLAVFMRESDRNRHTGVREKVMVAIDHRPVGRVLTRQGWRIAATLNADLVVVYVEPREGHRQTQTIEDERQLRSNLVVAEELGATIVRLRGKVADELVEYAQNNNVTHVVIGHPSHGRVREFILGSVTNDLLRRLPGIDVHVVATSAGRPAEGAYDPESDP